MNNWNFARPLSIDAFLAQKSAAGVKFFEKPEPWLVGIEKIDWTKFFRVCTEDMNNLSLRATKLVASKSLKKLRRKFEGNPRSPGQAALDFQYAEQYENK